MSDRTVAEVMGWVRLPDIPGVLGGMEGGWARPGTDQPTTPTPDDMLSWLREHSHTLRFYDNGDSFSVHTRSHPGAPVMFHRAPTLHAALEAAVLAVSAAQEEMDFHRAAMLNPEPSPAVKARLAELRSAAQEEGT